MQKRVLCGILAMVVLLFSMAGFAEDAWMNILLLGCDLKHGEEYGRSDTMIIASVNTTRNEVKLTSIMRDTWVRLPGHGEGKINAATVYGGPELAMEVVNRSFGTDIEKYALIDIEGMVSVIDTIGGIDIEINDQEMKYLNDHTVDTIQDIDLQQEIPPLKHSGFVHLCGAQAVQHARNRMVGTDYDRVNRQRQVILAIVQTITKECDSADILQIAKELTRYVGTNFTLMELLALGTVALKVDLGEIEQYRIPVDGTFNSGKEKGIWSIRPNFEKNQKLLNEFIYGDID